MPAELAFDFLGEQGLVRRLERFEVADADASAAFDRMGDLIAEVQGRQFASEGRSSSGGWAPLSPAYAAWKARTEGGKYAGNGILVLTGALRASITERPFAIDRVGRHSAEFGTDVPYGQYHQQGDGVPRRPVVDLPEATRRMLVKIMQEHLVKESRRAGSA